MSQNQFETCKLDEACALQAAQLTDSLKWSGDEFKKVWNCHPTEDQFVTIQGRPVKIPRDQQAFERDYKFAGQTSNAKFHSLCF